MHSMLFSWIDVCHLGGNAHGLGTSFSCCVWPSGWQTPSCKTKEANSLLVIHAFCGSHIANSSMCAQDCIYRFSFWRPIFREQFSCPYSTHAIIATLQTPPCVPNVYLHVSSLRTEAIISSPPCVHNVHIYIYIYIYMCVWLSHAIIYGIH